MAASKARNQAERMKAAFGWRFEAFPKNGGTNARGLSRELSGSGHEKAQRFAREGVQNSIDSEENASKPVRLRISLRSISGSERRKFLSTLALREPGGPHERKLLANDLPDPLPLLCFSDFNTVGLGGVESADQPRERLLDRFVGLCRNMGDAATDAEGGGTFGFGKVVYWNASASKIVLFHSRFKPTDRSQGAHTRLIGGALFNGHDYAQVRYTGRAWFGRVADDPDDPYVAPFTDEEAEELAMEFGFPPRSAATETGTSILIVNSIFKTREDIDALRTSIEHNYWPRLIDKRLEVVFEVDGKPMHPPQPEDPDTCPTLVPFIRAYRRAVQGQDLSEGDHLVRTISDRSGTPFGSLSLLVLEDDEARSLRKEEKDDSVALIRRPRMVIDYKKGFVRRSPIPFAGVFVAHDNFNSTLAKSEPIAHDQWDANADELSPQEANWITSLRKQIGDTIREFVNAKASDNDEEPTSCPELGRELARIFSVPGQGNSGERKSPIHIRPGTAPHRVSTPDGTCIEADFEITVDERKGKAAKAARLRLDVKPLIATDDGNSYEGMLAVDRLEVQVDGDTHSKQGRSSITIPIGSQEVTVLLRVRTGPLEHDEQTINLQPRAALSR